MESTNYTPRKWGIPVEVERRNRIRLAVAAYAYEFCDENVMTDHEFDMLARSIDAGMETGRPDLDDFFRKEFSPDTGQWIHNHPELDKVAQIYERWYKK